MYGRISQEPKLNRPITKAHLNLSVPQFEGEYTKENQDWTPLALGSGGRPPKATKDLELYFMVLFTHCLLICKADKRNPNHGFCED